MNNKPLTIKCGSQKQEQSYLYDINKFVIINDIIDNNFKKKLDNWKYGSRVIKKEDLENVKTTEEMKEKIKYLQEYPYFESDTKAVKWKMSKNRTSKNDLIDGNINEYIYITNDLLKKKHLELRTLASQTENIKIYDSDNQKIIFKLPIKANLASKTEYLQKILYRATSIVPSEIDKIDNDNDKLINY